MLKNVFAGIMGKNPVLMLSFIEDFINFIVRMVYGLYFLFLKAIAWVLDMLTQLFFIFAGMTDIGRTTAGDKDPGIDIVNFFLTQKSFMKAYGYLCLIALGLIVVFAIAKIIKQDYFDRSGPRSKAPIFRNIALSFIAFICVIPIFYFMIDAVGALALLVMKALGYEGGGIGTMLFNISWEDGGESFRTVGIGLMGNENSVELCKLGGKYVNLDVSSGACDAAEGTSFKFKISGLEKSKVWDDDNFGWYSADTFYAYYWDENNLGNRATPAQFYWYVFIFAGLIMIVNLGQMLLAMVTRLFKLVALFVVAPSPISQIVLDEGQKFKGWKDQVVQEALKVVGCVMSFMIFLLMASFVPEIDLMKFAFTEEAASASLLESGNMTTELSNSVSALYYHGKEPGWVDHSINALGRCMLLVAGVGAIKDIDSTITPFISGGKSSMDMGETGKSLVAAGKAVGTGAMAIARKGVDLAVSGAGAAVSLAGGAVSSLAGGASAGGRSLASIAGADGGPVATPDISGPSTPTPDPASPIDGGGDGGPGEADETVSTPETSTPTDIPENDNPGGDGGPGEVDDGAATPEGETPVENPTDGDDNGDAAQTPTNDSAAEATQAVDDAKQNLDDARRRDNNKNVILDEMQKITDKKPEDRTESDNKRLEQLEKAFNEVDASGDTLHDAQQKYDDAVAAADAASGTPSTEEPGVDAPPAEETDDSAAAPEGTEVPNPDATGTTEDVAPGAEDPDASATETATDPSGETATPTTDGGGESSATPQGGGTIHDVNSTLTPQHRTGAAIAKGALGVVAGINKFATKSALGIAGHTLKTGASLAGTAAKSGFSIAGIAAKTLFSMVGMSGVANAVEGTAKGVVEDITKNKQLKKAGKSIVKAGKDVVQAGKDIHDTATYKHDADGDYVDSSGQKVNKDGLHIDKDGNLLKDANGNYTDSAGNVCNKDGYRLEADGSVMVNANGEKVRAEGPAKTGFGQAMGTAGEAIKGAAHTVAESKFGKAVGVGVGILRAPIDLAFGNAGANSSLYKHAQWIDRKGREQHVKTTISQDASFNGALDSSSGSQSVSTGYEAVSNANSDADTVVAAANTMVDGANAQMNTAQEMNGLSEQVTGSTNGEMNANVDLTEAQAQRDAVAQTALENAETAHSYAEGIGTYSSAAQARLNERDTWVNNGKYRSESYDPATFAAKATISSMGTKLGNEYADVITKAKEARTNGTQLSREDSTRYAEYLGRMRELENAYRYVDGDTSVGAEAYESIRADVEGSSHYTSVMNGLTSREASMNKREKERLSANFRHQTGVERAFVGGMAARAAEYESVVAANNDFAMAEAEEAFNAQYANSSAYDRVSYERGNVQASTARYQEAVRGGNADEISAARADLEANATALREATIDLRGEMSGTSRDVVRRSRENAQNGGVKIGSVRRGTTTTGTSTGGTTRQTRTTTSGGNGSGAPKPAQQTRREVHVQAEGEPVSANPSQDAGATREASRGGETSQPTSTSYDVVIDVVNPVKQSEALGALAERAGSGDVASQAALCYGVGKTKRIDASADVYKVIDGMKTSPRKGVSDSQYRTEARKEYDSAIEDYNREMEAARTAAARWSGPQDTEVMRAVEESIAKATKAGEKIKVLKVELGIKEDE